MYICTYVRMNMYSFVRAPACVGDGIWMKSFDEAQHSKENYL